MHSVFFSPASFSHASFVMRTICCRYLRIACSLSLFLFSFYLSLSLLYSLSFSYILSFSLSFFLLPSYIYILTLSLSFFHPLYLFLCSPFFLIYVLPRVRRSTVARSIPPTAGYRILDEEAERNGKQRTRFSEIMYAASVENLGRLQHAARSSFSSLLIPSHPSSGA